MADIKDERDYIIRLTRDLNSGHELAFDALYRLLYPRLVNYASRMLNSRTAAESVVQDVFMNIWQNLGKTQIKGDISAYLHRSVFNRSVDRIKSTKKLVVMMTEEQQRFYFSNIIEQPEAETKLMDEELSRVVNKAIDALPPRCSEIFRLSWIEGMRNKDIAEKLNISEKTVENQITIAVRKLRSLLEAFGITAIFFLPF